MVFHISQALIDEYSRGPSPTRKSEAVAAQTRVREVLGTSDWDTFLQGSYRNDTAIAAINDVDVVALRKYATLPLPQARWETLFAEIRSNLKDSYRIQGSVRKRDKCVSITGSFNVDIVPAVPRVSRELDPIAIYSRRNGEAKSTYPRRHYDAGVAKQRATKNAFKPTVRLLKRWASQWTTPEPSFYLECAVYNVPDERFNTYLPLSFASVAGEILNWTRTKVIRTPGGGTDILVQSEWSPERFDSFKSRLLPDVKRVLEALDASTAAEANAKWRMVFGD